jgi:tRNA threonylcarbamoyladenosine biosynthesis protein TsaB
MALLLSVETSSQFCSVALHQNDQLVISKMTSEPRSAASQLAVMINEILRQSNCSPVDLAGVIVSAGPGSFTGLRIGVATAKGLCYGLNIPLISVNTLMVMAFQFIQSNRATQAGDDYLICPMLDARRMEVYCAVLDKQLHWVEPTQAKIIDPNSFDQHMRQHKMIFIGEGAGKCERIINNANAFFFGDVMPDAAFMGKLGFQKFLCGEIEDLAQFEPFYLKDFLIRKPNAV